MNTFPFPSLCRRVLTPVVLLCGATTRSQQVVSLSPVVVTAHHSEQPLTITLDPRAPVQPVPAQDGADILRDVAGFSVIRTGGADGDPMLRGMAGSRLGILVDGYVILGGCGNRMDPPTAYVHPAVFERVTIIKGPQSVTHGAGHSAGVVQFERVPARFDRAAAGFAGSFTFGSSGRRDAMATARAGAPLGFVEAVATRAALDDYATGAGTRVHSRYRRWSTQVAAGWTPDERTQFEIVGAIGDGEVAYADRAMDGVKFERQHVALHFTRSFRTGLLQRFEARTFLNHVDHVMDNFSLRSFAPSPAMPQPAASNPDRRTSGGRFAGKLSAGANTIELGADFQFNEHRVRSTPNALLAPITSLPRISDAGFKQCGLFAELSRPLTKSVRVISGMRFDDVQAKDRRAAISLGMAGSVPNPTADAGRHQTFATGFARLEHERGGITTFAGAGYTSRFPDYWELFSKESAASASAFSTRPEQTSQLDTGAIIQRGALAVSVSAFASRVNDYILIETAVRKGMRSVTVARNIDATTWGGEATASLRPATRWTVDVSIASVRGTNRTDNLPLAQQPPVDARVGLHYATPRWSLGALLRGAAAQRRVAPNQGNIAGQDIGPSGGFATLALNAGWSIRDRARLTAGVDNLFDRAYAEHISRGGAAISGYPQVLRVMEPGRTWWCKVDVTF